MVNIHGPVILLQLLSNFTIKDSHLSHLNVINGVIASADAERSVHSIAYFGRSDDIEPYITAASGIPKVVLTDSFSEIDFSNAGGFNHNIVFIAVGSLERKSVTYHLNKAFNRMQGFARGLFIIPQIASWRRLNFRDHFAWCWQHGFGNVLVLVENGSLAFNSYSYSRFPELRILQVDLLKPDNEYFSNKFINMAGYRVRSPLQYDPPRVFEMTDRYSMDKMSIKGYAAQMFQAFLKKHNGGLEIVQLDNTSRYNILGIIGQLNRDEIDVSMNPYIAYEGVRLSYPIKMMQWCILVPFSGEIEAFEYFLRPFQLATWHICMAGLLYLTLMKSLNERIQAPRRCRLEFGRSFLEMLRLMMFLPIPTLKQAKKFRWNYAACHMLVAILGFILSNLYTASLTSFLAKLIFDRQVDTLAEMVQRNLSINAIDYEIPIILNNRGLPKGFAELLVPRSATELVHDIITLKPNFAYSSREDMINFALMQQSHLLRPLFHVAGECLTTIPVGFMMPNHSQFEAILNSFILRSASSGLTDKWLRDSLTDGFLAGILSNRNAFQTNPTRALGLDHFQFAWLVLGGGSTLAAMCFALENICRIGRRIKVFVIYY